MAKARMAVGLLAGCLIWAGTAPVRAAPPVADMLRFRPRHDVTISTPTAQEMAACKVELLTGPGNASGWLLRDGKGQPLRRYMDTNGDKKLDVWSYYHEGIEVYREIDGDFDGKAEQYRWLNGAGTKWGVDLNGDGKIDVWKMISAEEVSQEILQAYLTKDYGRIQALWITDAELKSLGLPAAEVSRITEALKQGPARFQSSLAKTTGLTDKTKWVRFEAAPPQCWPAETSGGKQDLLKYPRGTVLYETSGKHDWLNTGEMVLVGAAWRLIELPTGTEDGNATAASTDPAVQKLLDQLKALDDTAPPVKGAAGPNPAAVKYNLQRADLLEQIVAKVKPEDREAWIRQVADGLSAAVQHSPGDDKTAVQRLVRLKEQLVKALPAGHALSAYVTFREMSADYALQLAGSKDPGKVQEQWLERLAKFVSDYPRAEDTPDALLQLGMVSEFVGKETEAKKWYELLVKQFAGHALAPKAQGALRRLGLEGQALDLAGPTLSGSPFDMAQVKGKLVVVYYWASWNQQCTGDFARLKQLLDTYGSKGLALVGINLDTNPEEAAAYLRQTAAPGVHLHQPGGLESPLAVQHGIMVLPNLFLVGKDGKVLSRTIQVGGLEEEIKKALK